MSGSIYSFPQINGLNIGNGDSFTPDVGAYSGLILVVTPIAPSMSTIYWTGDAGDNDWGDPGNWSSVDPAVSNVAGRLLPNAQDNVVIDLSGQTIDHSGNDTIGSLKVTGQNVTLNLEAGTLDLSGSGSAGMFQVDQPGDSVVVGDSILRSASVTGDTQINAVSYYYYPGTLDDCVINGTVDVAPYAAVNLTGQWTNNGTIIANAGSTLGLGSQISLAPTDPSAPDYYWTNKGTFSISSSATVEVGGILTTDAFDSLLPDFGNAYILFTGSLDNSPGDNRVSGGTFDVDLLPNGLTFFGGLVYEGAITSAKNTAIYGGHYSFNNGNGGALARGRDARRRDA